MSDFADLKMRRHGIKRQLVEAVQTWDRLHQMVERHGTVGLCSALGWEQEHVDAVNAAFSAAGHDCRIPSIDGATAQQQARDERQVKAEARAAAPPKGLCTKCGKRPKAKPKHRCQWCLLASLPIEQQIAAAEARREQSAGAEYRARVPQAEWPDGERWCSGCQGFIPLDYCSGSRCRAHASMAAHGQRLESVYSITREQYEQLLAHQGGRCYICRREVHSKRLAVDHDHATGEVRGLLCADSERGCNHAILGNIRNLAMAQRIVDYLADPPARQVLRPQSVDPDAPHARPFIDPPF